MEKWKNLVSVYQTFKNLLLQKTQQNSYKLHTNSPWVCVIKDYSNGGASYIIDELIAKTQFEHRKFNANLCKSSSPKLL